MSVSAAEAAIPIGHIVPILAVFNRSKPTRKAMWSVMTLYNLFVIFITVARGVAEVDSSCCESRRSRQGIERVAYWSVCVNLAMGLARVIFSHEYAILWLEKVVPTTLSPAASYLYSDNWLQLRLGAKFVWQYIVAVWRGEQINPWSAETHTFEVSTYIMSYAIQNRPPTLARAKVALYTPANAALAIGHTAVVMGVAALSLLAAWQIWRVPVVGYALQTYLLYYGMNAALVGCKFSMNQCDMEWSSSTPDSVTHKILNADAADAHSAYSLKLWRKVKN